MKTTILQDPKTSLYFVDDQGFVSKIPRGGTLFDPLDKDAMNAVGTRWGAGFKLIQVIRASSIFVPALDIMLEKVRERVISQVTANLEVHTMKDSDAVMHAMAYGVAQSMAEHFQYDEAIMTAAAVFCLEAVGREEIANTIRLAQLQH